jgi:hypothetical protein
LAVKAAKNAFSLCAWSIEICDEQGTAWSQNSAHFARALFLCLAGQEW